MPRITVTGDLQTIQISNNDQNAKVVTISNSNSLPINNTRSSKFFLADKLVHIRDILHAPLIKKNLLSINKFCFDNFVSLRFDDQHVYMKDRRTNEEVMIRSAKEGPYQINLDEEAHTSEVNIYTKVDLETWHCPFGHIYENSTRQLVDLYNLPVKNEFSM